MGNLRRVYLFQIFMHDYKLHPIRSQDLAYMNHNMVNALKWISRIASSKPNAPLLSDNAC